VADLIVIPQVLVLAGGGIIAGIGLLIRGFGGYGTATRIADTATSRISALAVGEVHVSGTVEPAELALVSPLQSARCVYYRARIRESGRDDDRTVFEEERAVGFRIRDASGTVRVFPRAARFDVPARFDEATGLLGDAPPSLRMRSGASIGVGEPTREQQIAELLTIRRPGTLPDENAADTASPGGWTLRARSPGRNRRYSEARIEPGDVVTVLGRAMPFDQLPDPAAADTVDGPPDPMSGLRDPEIAADLAAARAAGILADDPAEAWGNAAIPGFGIGRPVRDPDLHPDAYDPPLATSEEAARVERTFTIEPDALILAAAHDTPLLIATGAPEVAAGRHEQRFLVGLLGAILAIGSAMALAVMLNGGFGT
jgi:hypothetical protein